MSETIYTAYLTGSLKLSKEGQWFHNGTAFSNDKVSELFHRSVRWVDSEKKFYIYIGKGRATFDYEDTGYFVSAIDQTANPWLLSFLHQKTEPLDFERLYFGPEHQLYYKMQNELLARFKRNTYQQMLEYAHSDSSLMINGQELFIKTISNEL